MIQNNTYKRQTRQLSDRQKQLISQKLKGRKKSSQHIEHISMGMKKCGRILRVQMATFNYKSLSN